MDLILQAADYLFLDNVYAKLLPLSAFSDRYVSPSFSLNGTALPAALYSSSSSLGSSWNDFISTSYIPLPKSPAADLTASFADASTISAWPRDYVPRQMLSLIGLTMIGIHIMYFLFAGISYYFIFNHDMMNHPRYLKNQIRLEIEASLRSFPWMMVIFLPFFQLEVMGYSKLYNDPAEYGWPYFFFSIAWFLLFTDYAIYWIHRILHWPSIYKYIHKPHHKWIVPTPFASHAFHPLDGCSQGAPYHAFIFLFPMQRHLYLAMFIFVNIWTILIHDSDMITGHPLEHIINGPAHHTLHHLYFTVNYGQYFTWADKYYQSYKHPAAELDPLLEAQMAKRKSEEKKSS